MHKLEIRLIHLISEGVEVVLQLLFDCLDFILQLVIVGHQSPLRDWHIPFPFDIAFKFFQVGQDVW